LAAEDEEDARKIEGLTPCRGFFKYVWAREKQEMEDIGIMVLAAQLMITIASCDGGRQGEERRSKGVQKDLTLPVFPDI
jgi:hypothetical protein